MATTDDLMNPEQLLDTLRDLVQEVHTAKTGRQVAVQAVAAVHIFHILDVMLSAGHSMPESWRKPPTWSEVFGCSTHSR